jgi:phosphatidylserine/phosphatidylglycerophosphate/cardiolipin synthase-like enzyme
MKTLAMPEASARVLTSCMTNLFRWCLIFFFCYAFTASAAEHLIIEPEDGRAPLYSAMQQARSSIQVVMYGFTDTDLLDSLIQSQIAGKKLQILLEKTPYRSETENDTAIAKLKAEKIDWQPAYNLFKLTHQKTMLIDQRKAIIMTFNFTHSTFKNERNFALVIDDPNEVSEIEKVFMADWLRKETTVNHPDLVWSPDNSRQKLLNFIRSAHSEIKVYAQDISDYQTIGALAKAARNGIKVEILLSKINNPSRKIDYLKNAGVNVHTCKKYYIHAKVIIVDKSSALLGSLNFTAPSINKNRELAIITHDPQVVKQLNQTFNEDFGNSLMPSWNEAFTKLTKYMLRHPHRHPWY